MSGEQKRKLAQFGLAALFFAVPWPPVMTVYYTLTLAPVLYFNDGDAMVQVLMWLPFTLLFSYRIWFVPALLTGLYAAAAAAIAGERRSSVFHAALAGGACAAVRAWIEPTGTWPATAVALGAGALATATLWLALKRLPAAAS
ncbi:hypothetical protein DWF00_14425 [Bosea caraganae]|uniref:Uncharacterized protein n=1 Tax=Bosea caraganae TaxID=2763117 RepID=A0A370KY47_9HYPH|nr:hypothetical protein [Bosea caraganae]RDJ19876.1 hypothetical protein DWE98_27600 [Bosea caraganae]RDJ25606.1 hypothetical protein DWF00_14425 [Bosea caraganae]